MLWRCLLGDHGMRWLVGGVGLLACLRPVDDGPPAPPREAAVVASGAAAGEGGEAIAGPAGEGGGEVITPEPADTGMIDADVDADADTDADADEGADAAAIDVAPSPPAPGPAAAAGASPAVAAALPVRRLLGLGEPRVARVLGREGEPGEGGWRHYGASVAVRFEAGRAVAVAVQVPGGLACEAAARWAGFPRATAPLRRASACSWPGISDRHRLARGIVGELELTTGVLHVWRP